MQKETLHFAPEFRHGSQQRFLPRVDDDGPLRIQPIERVADRRPHPPLDAIADDGLAERPRHREADARAGEFGLAEAESGKTRAGKASPLVINPSEIL